MRATLLILAALTASAQERQPGRGVNFYSVEREAALGAGLAADILSNATPIDSTLVQDFVNRIGSRLSFQLRGAPFPYTFTVLAGDGNNFTHEPVALPGGHVFIPTALILAAKDEAEFAGMLAHAMIHVSERHATRSATREAIANDATIPLMFTGGWTGYGVKQASSVLVPPGFSKFQRGFETEADVLAIKITWMADFDPSALVRYVGRVGESSPGTTSRVFSPLPTPAERVSRMETEIQMLTPQAYLTPDPAVFESIQAEVRRLIPIAERPQPPQLKKVADDTERPTLKRQN
jgi:predicted Zn-dependent protease